MQTSQPLKHQLFLTLNSGVQDGLAKTSATPTPAKEKASLASEADCSITLWSLLQNLGQRGLSWKMCQGSSRQSKEPRLRQLSTRWKKTGIWGDGFRATLSMRACPTTATEYSLSQVIDQDVPITSLLSAANCTGVLRREKRAGRKLDPIFEKSLKETLRLWFNVAEASGIPKQKALAPRYVPKLEAIKEVIQTGQYSVARNLTWTECEKLMGFPAGWTVVEGGSLATPSPQQLPNGSGDK